MIRVVQFEYFAAGRADHVAFVDTVTDKFLEYCGEQFWATWSELFDSMTKVNTDPNFMLRLKGLCPVWFMDNHEAWREDDG